MAIALKFLFEHLDLLELLFEAISGGVTKEKIVAQIKKEIVKASKARMRAELG